MASSYAPQQSFGTPSQSSSTSDRLLDQRFALFGGANNYLDRPQFGNTGSSNRGTGASTFVEPFSTSVPSSSVPSSGVPSSGMPSSGVPSSGVPSSGMPPPQQRVDARLYNGALPNAPNAFSADFPQQPNATTVRTMSGETVPASQFVHNNMVPFFGGTVKQNVSANGFASVVERHTGVSAVEQRKEPVAAMFAPEKNVGYVHGAPSVPEDLRNIRYNPSNYRQGEKPMYEERVGPGLNKGFTAQPSGGFQQADVRDYALPKTVDELRVATNPKVTYTEPVIRGIAPHQKPGKHGSVTKNRPDTFFVNTPSRYNTTTGAVKGRRIRTQPIDKYTHRQHTTRHHTGAAGNGTNVRERDRKMQHLRTAEPFRVENKLDSDGVRNATGGERWGDVDAFTGTYGKQGIEVLPNERDTTQLNDYLSNAVSFVKEMVKPLEDLMRTSRKENTIGNPRISGNMGANVRKQAVHDPNDVARTTLKETNIHDQRTGNLAGTRFTAPVYDPNDIARTTLKETTIHDERTGNIGDTTRRAVPVYDPNDIARTTLKETTIHDERTGNIGDTTRRAVPAYDPNDIARTTLKETTIHDTRTGYIGDQTRHAVPVYDPNDIARTTIKETNIHDNRLGQLSAQPSGEAQGGKQHGVVGFQDEAKTTVRETTRPEDTGVNLNGGVLRPTVYDPNDVARTTIKETNIDAPRQQGNVTGLDSREGYTTNPKHAPNTNRQFTSDREYAGGAGVSEGNREGGYQVADVHAPATQRHELSDKDYTGGARSRNTAPTSQTDAYNARTDEVKEKVAEGRQPTLTGAKALPDKGMVCMEQKDDHDRANQRDLATTRVEQLPVHKSVCSVTKDKKTLAETARTDNVDPSLLAAYKANPYTQPLNTSV